MRISRLALALALAAAAVALALVAADVRTWRATMRSDDASLAAGGRAAPRWQASTVLPPGATRRLLALDDDRALRRAVLGFSRVARVGGGFDAGVRRRARAAAEARLAEVAATEDARHASHASNLLGILAFADATSGRRAATPVDRSLAAFREAVRLDPENESAKDNLELLLRLLEARGQRIGPNRGTGPRGQGRRGAGGGEAGRGY